MVKDEHLKMQAVAARVLCTRLKQIEVVSISNKDSVRIVDVIYRVKGNGFRYRFEVLDGKVLAWYRLLREVSS